MAAWVAVGLCLVFLFCLGSGFGLVVCGLLLLLAKRHDGARRHVQLVGKMDSREAAVSRKPALARGSWTGNAPAVVERNRRRAARLQAARPSMHGNAANAAPAPPYGPVLGCCAYATFVGDGAEYACAARVWAQRQAYSTIRQPTRLPLTTHACAGSVLETGTAHPVVIVATTHMHGGLGNLSGQVRLAHYPPAPSLGKHNFAVTFGKLWAGQLPYARVVYVDADTLVLRSLDHLFTLGPKVGLTPTPALTLSLSLSLPLSLPLGGPRRAARLLAGAALLPERRAHAHQHEQVGLGLGLGLVLLERKPMLINTSGRAPWPPPPTALLSRGYHPCCTHDTPLPTRGHVPWSPPLPTRAASASAVRCGTSCRPATPGRWTGSTRSTATRRTSRGTPSPVREA